MGLLRRVDVYLGLLQVIDVDWREQYGDADRNCEESTRISVMLKGAMDEQSAIAGWYS